MHQSFNSQKILHNLPSQVSYGVYSVNILQKNVCYDGRHFTMSLIYHDGCCFMSQKALNQIWWLVINLLKLDTFGGVVLLLFDMRQYCIFHNNDKDKT